MQKWEDDNGLLELEKFSNGYIKSVKLGSGWEDTDLSSNVDFDLALKSGRNRSIYIVSANHVDKIIKDKGFYWQNDGYFVVEEINPEIVKKILNSVKWS